MPQNPSLINKNFKSVLESNPLLTTDKTTEEAKEAKKTLLKLMLNSLGTLRKTNRISQNHYQWASESIKFYNEHTDLLPGHKNPKNLLSELTAIDYSKPVNIVRVKKGRIMTQMQHPDDHRHDKISGKFSPEAIGSFYTEGTLPSSFKERADQSGIGIKSDRAIQSNPDRKQEDKSVYQFKISRTSTFLRSVASEANDTWSLKGVSQPTKGGGVQWRIATADYSNMQREIYGELESAKAVNQTKPLKKGVRLDIDALVSSVTSTSEIKKRNITPSKVRKHRKKPQGKYR